MPASPAYNGTIQSSADWAKAVLVDGGAPVTDNNIANILVWMRNEEPAARWNNRNNPLNASLGTSASDGTGSYPDLRTSAYYTAQMIFNQPNMAGIASALSNDAPRTPFAQAVIGSPWASSHYGNDISRFGGNPAVVGGTSVPHGATVAAGSQGGAAPGACDSNVALINASPFHLISQCQASALLGGLLMGVGALGMFLAVGLFVASGFGKQGVLQTAQRLPGPAGSAARVAGGTGPVRRPQRRSGGAGGGLTKGQTADLEELRQRREEDARRREAQGDRQAREERERAEGFPSDRGEGSRAPVSRRTPAQRRQGGGRAA